MKTRAELVRLISMAKKLGFRDDVQHWTNELNKLDNESRTND